jgi:two-component system response regulator
MHHVLLVEDNPGDVALTRIAFEESGLAVRLQAATSFKDARMLLDALEARSGDWHPALVLLDLNLVDGSGHDLLAYLKQQPGLKNIPVVIVTTSDSPQDRARSISLGAAAYLVKPNSFDCFVSALKNLAPLLG